jgi:hypothetical protein
MSRKRIGLIAVDPDKYRLDRDHDGGGCESF